MPRFRPGDRVISVATQKEGVILTVIRDSVGRIELTVVMEYDAGPGAAPHRLVQHELTAPVDHFIPYVELPDLTDPDAVDRWLET